MALTLNMYNNASVSSYKDTPQKIDDLSDESSSSISEEQVSKYLISIQLSGTQNKNVEKSKAYFFEKENDDYKNFLN